MFFVIVKRTGIDGFSNFGNNGRKLVGNGAVQSLIGIGIFIFNDIILYAFVPDTQSEVKLTIILIE